MFLKKNLRICLLFFVTLYINSVWAQEKHVSDLKVNNKELLLRMPLLSDKTAGIVENALRSLNGIQRVEACYDPGTMIITYRSDIITDENLIVEKIRQQEINTTVEPITTRDIPIIRKNYTVVQLHSNSE